MTVNRDIAIRLVLVIFYPGRSPQPPLKKQGCFILQGQEVRQYH